MEKQIYEALSGILNEEHIRCNEPLNGHTTFRVGGPASFFVEIDSVEKLQKLVSVLQERDIPFFMLGKGSNLLVSDAGYKGVVICLGEKMSEVSCEGQMLRAGAGASLAKVAAFALQNSLTGFEFAAGIPGTVGGAMVMNAGAYGGEMKQVVQSVSVVDENGKERILSCDEMNFGYRTSILKNKPYIVTEVCFMLQRGEVKEIEETMKTLARRRMEKQPLEYSSAGSTFKRPEGHFAGKLIGDAGLSGYSIGGAQVSEKHNGFVINTGAATAAEIRELIVYVQKKVAETSGVFLEPEVIMLGEE